MRWLVLFLVFSTLSCSSFIKDQVKVAEISRYLNPTTEAYEKLKNPYVSTYGELPFENHEKVDFWIKYFTTRGRDLMQLYLERSSRYFPIMKSVLREKGLPEELVYVALIESGFSSQAHSRANAVGYWQFIKGTGRRYGLRINHFVDERKDPVLSTRAAAEYFKDLYSLFGSWHLALSAYNAGEYRINRVVLRHYNRNFWYLISKGSLPKETSNYIPKFIAARRIGKNPEKYGFDNIQYQKPFEYDIVKVKKSISLRKLSKNLSLNYKKIRKMNPMYKGEYVPIYDDLVTVRVPVGLQNKASYALAASFMKAPKYSYLDHYWYRVRRGDTLSRIAVRNKTTISSLKRTNRIGRSSLIRVGQKLKIPVRKLAAVRYKAPSSKATALTHKVKRGDTLFHIAKKYKTSVSNLKSLNKIKGSVLRVGQVLKLKSSQKRRPANKSKKLNYYTVRSGDTLIGIAKKYNITLPRLMQANSLNFRSVLLTGTRLIIP